MLHQITFIQFNTLQSEEEIEWFSQRYEKLPNENVDNETKKRIAIDLLRSQVFDNFLANKFSSVKRYGGEGAESATAFFSEFFKLSAQGKSQSLLQNAKIIIPF